MACSGFGCVAIVWRRGCSWGGVADRSGAEVLSCIRECGWAVRTETACLTPPLTFLQVVQSLWELQLRV